jgi:ArsR family transcriptional regulator
MDAKLAVEALSALAQEHRLAAFRLLVQAGQDGLPAGTIAETLGVAASSMSFHLAALAHAGLVTQQRRSRLIIYTAHYASMNALMGYLTENCCGGVPCAPDAFCPTPALGETS